MALLLGNLALYAKRIGDVLLVTVRGVFTLGAAPDLRAFVQQEIQREDARAAVVDMRGSIWLLTHDDWARLGVEGVRYALAQRAVSLPIAMLVDDEIIGRMRVNCREQAKHGLLRMAFTEYGQAVSWASRRMEHWECPPLLPSV